MEKVLQYKELVEKYCEKYSIPPALILAMMWVESRGNPDAVNAKSDATGLMQVVPKKPGFETRPTQEELLDPETNIEWGCKVLAWFRGIEDGDLVRGVYRYSGGFQAWLDGVGLSKVVVSSLLPDHLRMIAFARFLKMYWAKVVVKVAELEGLNEPG